MTPNPPRRRSHESCGGAMSILDLPSTSPENDEDGNHDSDEEAHREPDCAGVAGLQVHEGVLEHQHREHLRCARRAALGKYPDVVEGEERPDAGHQDHEHQGWPNPGNGDVTEFLP